MRLLTTVHAIFCFIFIPLNVMALQPGEAAGSLVIDKTEVKLAFAVSSEVENLFYSSRKDKVIALSDRPLDEVSPDDQVGLGMAAVQSSLTALVLRLDGIKLVNAGLYRAGQSGVTLLPGSWFELSPSSGAISLKLSPNSFDNHTYAGTVDFRAKAFVPPPTPAPEPTPTEYPPTPTLPAASTSFISPKASTALLVQAIMQKDEHQAVGIINTGMDPNSRDQYGIPVLNWAIMSCLPKVVKALVDKKADLNYERSPGLTVMQEAGACPEAAAILKAAGAK